MTSILRFLGRHEPKVGNQDSSPEHSRTQNKQSAQNSNSTSHFKRRILPLVCAAVVLVVATAGLLAIFEQLSGPFGTAGQGQGQSPGSGLGVQTNGGGGSLGEVPGGTPKASVAGQTDGAGATEKKEPTETPKPSTIGQTDGRTPAETAKPSATGQTDEARKLCTCSGAISPKGGLPPPIPVFKVKGAARSGLLRQVAASSYDGKLWNVAGESQRREYGGEQLEYAVSGFSSTESDRITVIPITEFSPGFIPTSLYPTQVSLGTALTYYIDEFGFFAESDFSTSYTFSTVHYQFDESSLRAGRVVSDQRYLQLPDTVTERTTTLARQIVQGLYTPYDKIEAIQTYLQTNYRYSPSYERAPPDWEPNDWFLFEEKKGVCANFNSAFAILGRAVGIPTRLVAGFAIRETPEEQVVKANQAHAWVEIAFEDLGWIEFDATGPSWKIPTVTRIGSVAAVAQKGYSFEVEGEVLTEDGGGIEGLPVEILISETRQRGGAIVGKGETAHGRFKITCTASREIEVGEYYVVAHCMGNDVYAESWSESETKLTLPSVSENAPQTTIPTTTEIAVIAAVARKGHSFDVEGTVSTKQGLGVGNVSVEVLLNRTKEKGGTLVGAGKTAGGHFKITCVPPGEMEIGQYQVIAHALGDSRYSESWSDPAIKIVTATTVALQLPKTVDVKKTFAIRGSLMEEFGDPVPNEEVVILVEGRGVITRLTSGEQGGFSVDYAFDSVGTYTITAQFKGTEYYLESTASADIRVMMPTSVVMDVVPRAMVSQPVSIDGALKDAQGRGVVGQRVEIRVDGDMVATPTTLEGGAFSAEQTFKTTGTHRIEAVFKGSEYLRESSAFAEVLVVKVMIDIRTPETFVRGDEAHLGGAVSLGVNVLPNETMAILFDGARLADPVTNAQGEFEFAYRVPSTTALGSHHVEYRAVRFDVSEMQDVTVKARTSLALSPPPSAHPGDRVAVEARLLDDLESPIGGANITVQGAGILSNWGATNDRGTAYVSVDIPHDLPASSLSLECGFPGTVLYLPCRGTLGLPILPKNPFPWWALGFVALPALGASGGYLLYRRRRGEKSPPALTGDDAVKAAVAVSQRGLPTLTIHFPQIGENLPDVWGLGDELAVEFFPSDERQQDLAGKTVEVRVGEDAARTLSLDSGGKAALAHSFSSEGMYEVVCRTSDDNGSDSAAATRTIRVVDYRKEIVALFDSLVAWIQGRGTPLAPDGTPREIQEAIRRALKGVNEEALEAVVGCFEEADYSTHEILRKHYEAMFVAQMQVKYSYGA